MASFHLLCNTFHFQPSCNLSSKSNISSFKPRGPFSFCQQLQFPKTPVVKATGKKVELVYDPDGRINNLADEVDKQAPLSRLTLFSPCKVNVFLRITSKREDGYHDLASLFHVISLGDVIKFSLSPSKSIDRLSTNVSGVPLTEDNLIIKALNLYRKKTGTENFFWIHLDKKVPTGAGLGGGSSNAATALWAANQFSGCLATEKELQEWSSEIGSDIPFFFSHGAAYCTGRGEIVQDIPSLVPLDKPMVLIKPPQACSTAEVYKRFQLDKTSQADPLTLLEKISRNGISQDVCINDLEPPAFEVLASLKRLKQRIAAAGRGQYDAVFMSGSGSTIVGIGSPDPPQFIYDEDEYQDVFVSEANFVNREANQWYQQPGSSSTICDSPPEFTRSIE
ncbi:4-diphosphocytidyl-2-C-methyl-D-erythritol kinase, chloroplastic/chromoplastic-like [Populus nigra]|uniref:4-diphosphocytidyl-2-C-methyl-D-erythritol kinase, chloroplastic/chromoplastic-like n=1 Tax=Populus nigra TaxID=3691 RepID=UPI002B26F88C|nr:4-diphosphocytidyl-2-C-methyl-D-erythritol kinase, chloroplastic/chromoplastic-like [Populus nigra]